MVEVVAGGGWDLDVRRLKRHADGPAFAADGGSSDKVVSKTDGGRRKGLRLLPSVLSPCLRRL